MFKVTPLVSALLILVAGCVSSPEEKARQDHIAEQKKKNADIWSAREKATYRGNSYEVAVSGDQTFAFVRPAKGFAYSPKDIGGVAGQVSGCRAKMSAGVLAFVGGYNEDVDLQELQAKVTNFKYWRANLEC
ncbi:MAG: hypothetical protein GYB25_11785 [Rhodobacteraceae bacterium]|nr:hypothetical protein [Paracoccaceae bacterium]